jgi:hypothetical protein
VASWWSLVSRAGQCGQPPIFICALLFILDFFGWLTFCFTFVLGRYECLLASLCVSSIIGELFEDASYQIVDCDVQNIVAHSEIPLKPGQTLNIQQMYESMPMECTYQKNMFPGLIYRSKDVPVVLLCFYSGKVVLTGGKSLSDICMGWKRLWCVVQRFIA